MISAWAVLPMLLVAPLTADGVDITTQVRLQRAGKPARGQSLSGAVVVWQPASNRGVQAERVEIVTEGKSFRPQSLAVPVGSTVVFPNRDPILHNVFSVSAGNAFDLGLLGKGPGGSVVLQRPGLVRVFCNVHRQMFSTILVVDSPFVARPDSSGRVHLEDLPEGPGKLILWHQYAELVEMRLDSPDQTPPLLELEVKRRQVPPHFNKVGRPYARRSRGRYIRD